MLAFQKNGNLIPGIHVLDISEVEKEFAYNPIRKNLFEGLKLAMNHLKDSGCQRLFLDGSYVTTKEDPGDFDACWDHTGVDLNYLRSNYPVLLDFKNERENQKKIYKGELFLAIMNATPFDIYINFFQMDKDDYPKGIVLINLI